ncbi:MAG: Rieske 2Fe-2S domain-containing protein [Beijerinckiaceae bacterium]
MTPPDDSSAGKAARASARTKRTAAPLRKTASDVDLATTQRGTPGGIFMRQFWIAVHRSEDLARGEAKPIRIMGENYALYRGESGRAQVIAYHCPHRWAPMHLGWIEGDDIRCVYHGWKFDCSGQCKEQPAEGKGFARKVKIATWPTQEYLGLVWCYFGEDKPPAFPPFPHRETEGIIQTWNVEHVPCNYLQSFENSMDEVHVAFTHAPGGSHAKLAADLPLISTEETGWGMIRYGKRKTGLVRQTLHYAPNVTRVIVPPVAGMEGVGGWPEIYFSFTPVDDENHIWYITSHIELKKSELPAYRRQRKKYERELAKARPSADMAADLIRGNYRYADVRHPDLAIVQDVAVQAGQGRIADRQNERLGRSDAGLIAWRKILTRELRLIAAGKKPKRWKTPPPDVKPTLGF